MQNFENAMIIKNIMEKFTGKKYGLFWDIRYDCYRTFPENERRPFCAPCSERMDISQSTFC